jgi:hypothetical protein
MNTDLCNAKGLIGDSCDALLDSVLNSISIFKLAQAL